MTIASTLEDKRGEASAKFEQLAAGDLTTYISVLTHQWSQTLATLGISLIPIFFILDVFMMPPELLPRFGVNRGLTTLIIIAQLFFIRHTKPSRLSFLHGYFFSLVAGTMIAIMTTDLGGFQSTYYAGLNLVMIAVNLLLPWEFLHSAINSTLIIGLYVLWNVVIPQSTPVATASIVNNLYFLTGTAVVSTSINFVKQRLIKQEFFLRTDLKGARDALWGEMEIAKHIQTALLPKIHALRHFQVAAIMQPADEVGGDYYDIVETAAGETWACIGDVSGHGVASGLIMMMTQTSVYSIVNEQAGLPPSRVLSLVNAVLRENISRLGADRYVTATLLRLEKDRFVFAGCHQDILVFRAATATIEVVPTTGSWLGIVDDLMPHLADGSAALAPDDIILLFTDGITEATNASHEMFGEDRLRQALLRYASSSVDDIVANVLRDVRKFTSVQYDDLTLVALRRSDARSR